MKVHISIIEAECSEIVRDCLFPLYRASRWRKCYILSPRPRRSLGNR